MRPPRPEHSEPGVEPLGPDQDDAPHPRLPRDMVELSLKENSFDADVCVPATLANVATNNYADAGLEVCGSDDGS